MLLGFMRFINVPLVLTVLLCLVFTSFYIIVQRLIILKWTGIEVKLFNAGDFYLLSLLRVAVQSKDILNKVLRQTMDMLESKDIEAPSEVQRLQQQLDQVVAENKTLKETVQRLSNKSDDSEIDQ